MLSFLYFYPAVKMIDGKTIRDEGYVAYIQLVKHGKYERLKVRMEGQDSPVARAFSATCGVAHLESGYYRVRNVHIREPLEDTPKKREFLSDLVHSFEVQAAIDESHDKGIFPSEEVKVSYFSYNGVCFRRNKLPRCAPNRNRGGHSGTAHSYANRHKD